MSLFEKIALLFKANKPATQLVSQLKEAKAGYKTVSFWVTLLGTLLALIAAIKAVIPATTALVAITVITALYNVLRGLDKAGTDTNRGTFRSTEFWLAILGEASKAIVALQTGGVNPAWMASLSTIVAAAMAAAQNLSAQPKATSNE